jgi:ribosomal protein S6--L-glutamate ligase
MARRKLKICILSRSENIYSTSRLVSAAKKRGHSAVVVNHLRCYMDMSPNAPMTYYLDKKLSGFDAVIPRIGASVTYYGTAVVRQFEMMGTYSLNESVAITRSRDKLRSLQLLSRKGIGLPVTSFAHSTKMSTELIRMVGGSPLIIKLVEGTQGKGVILAETDQAAKSVIDAFREMDAYFLVQEYIKEAGGKDIRCFVIGDKVVASMMRTAKRGEFRSNLHRGGSAKEVVLSKAERETAVRAAQILGLSVAGVDLLRSNRGPLIMEVNSSPGLRGIEGATKIDVASLIIQHIEEHAKKGKTQTKGKG